jgi:hypothetical protein
MNRKLTPEQQIFIVQQLACMLAPSEVVESVKIEFKVNVTRQLVWTYNPQNNPDLAPDLTELFEKTRKAFEDESISIRIQKRTFRLIKLDAMITQAERARNLPLAAQLLEQVAKECGGSFTNKQHQEVNLQGNLVTGSLQEWKAEHDKRRKEAEATMAEFADEPKEDEPAEGQS